MPLGLPVGLVSYWASPPQSPPFLPSSLSQFKLKHWLMPSTKHCTYKTLCCGALERDSAQMTPNRVHRSHIYQGDCVLTNYAHKFAPSPPTNLVHKEMLIHIWIWAWAMLVDDNMLCTGFKRQGAEAPAHIQLWSCWQGSICPRQGRVPVKAGADFIWEPVAV